MTTATRSDMRYQRNSAVEAAPLKDASVLFNPNTNKFCLLNSTMAFIWSRLEREASASEIAAQISSSFAGVTAEQAAADVEQALAAMMELDLLVASGHEA